MSGDETKDESNRTRLPPSTPAAEAVSGLRAYVPHRFLLGRDLQTIIPSIWPKPPWDSRCEAWDIEVQLHNQVRVWVSYPDVPPRGTVVLLHGMGGSSESTYVVRTGQAALRAGWVVARMNLRNCGGTEHLATTLYNAGQSDDLDRVFAHFEGKLPRPFAAVGYSLSGNICLRYAGVAGDACRADALVGVNPPVDLDRCLQEMELPRNRLYNRNFVRKLSRQLSGIAAVRDLGAPIPEPAKISGMREFDSLYTAPMSGFPSVDAYYAEASAAPRLHGARRPCWILSAVNDPVIPASIFPQYRSARVEVELPNGGGHCGYWQRGQPRFWAGEAILHWLEKACSPGFGSSKP